MTRMIRWLGAAMLTVLLAAPVFARDGDVVVKVKDPKGKAIAGADLFFVVKTWPNNRYRQRAYQGKTDKKGGFRLEGKYVVGEKYAVQVAVLAEGHALESFYEFVKDGGELAPVDLKLSKGQETLLRFLGEDGQPVRGVVAYPGKRSPAAGGEHSLYLQGSESVHRTSDERGEVRVTWFVAGDRATVGARYPGAEWREHEVEIKGEAVDIRGSAAAPEENASADVADVPAQERTVRKNDRQRYFLIGSQDKKAAGKNGFGLILVLPGGDGGDGFHTFVKRIHKNAVPKGYLTAQLVAVQWNPDQAKNLVWPTAKSRVKGLQFTTEEYVEAVIADIGKRIRLDPRRIFTLSWSSGGPACYAVSLAKKTSVTGSFIAMSVFHPSNLPSLTNAKGHPYYILHSPDDKVCAYKLAEKARDSLRKKGALVEFATYAGGHGWHGNVYAMLSKGFTWLDGHGAGRK